MSKQNADSDTAELRQIGRGVDALGLAEAGNCVLEGREPDASTVTIKLADLSQDCSDSLVAFRAALKQAGQQRWRAESRDASQGPLSLQHLCPGPEVSSVVAASVATGNTMSAGASSTRYMSETKASKTKTRAAQLEEEERRRAERTQSPSKVPKRILKMTSSMRSHVEVLHASKDSAADKKQVPELEPSSRLFRPTVNSISREMERVEQERFDQHKRDRMNSVPTLEEELTFRRLMKKQTVSSKRRGEATASAGVADPQIRLVSTVAEGSGSWGGRWGLREQTSAAWVGPTAAAARSPGTNNAGDESDHESAGDLDCADPISGKFLRMSPRSRAIVNDKPELKQRSIHDKAQAWAQERMALREQEKALEREMEQALLMAGHRSTFAADRRPGDPQQVHEEASNVYGERYLQLKEKYREQKRFDNEEANNLLTLLASLPDGYRQNVEKMIDTLPNPYVDADQGVARLCSSGRDTTSHEGEAALAQWGHREVLHEHLGISAASPRDPTSKPKGAAESTKSKPVRQEVYHARAVDKHVQRLKRFRQEKLREQKEREERLLAKSWTPRATVPKPFKLSKGNQPPQESEEKAPKEALRTLRKKTRKKRRKKKAELQSSPQRVGSPKEAPRPRFPAPICSSQEAAEQARRHQDHRRDAFARAGFCRHVHCSRAKAIDKMLDEDALPESIVGKFHTNAFPISRPSSQESSVSETECKSNNSQQESTLLIQPALFASKQDIEQFLQRAKTKP
ncbi:Uncharacterized protein SCF082_LOCUS5655 [Durusdinium trenchii]|uniref:Uncharacterized protein n=1 Tax=Durusdinium trenchii TaxID=1381693 RepID=A0ABP0IAM1_9DINO